MTWRCTKRAGVQLRAAPSLHPPGAGREPPATPGPPRRHRQLPALPPRRMPGGGQRSAVPYRATGYPRWDGTAGRLSRCCSPPLLPAPCTRPGLTSRGLSPSDGERRLQRRCYDLFTLLTAPEFLFPLLSSPQLFKDRSNSCVRTSAASPAASPAPQTCTAEIQRANGIPNLTASTARQRRHREGSKSAASPHTTFVTEERSLHRSNVLLAR